LVNSDRFKTFTFLKDHVTLKTGVMKLKMQLTMTLKKVKTVIVIILLFILLIKCVFILSRERMIKGLLLFS